MIFLIYHYSNIGLQRTTAMDTNDKWILGLKMPLMISYTETVLHGLLHDYL